MKSFLPFLFIFGVLSVVYGQEAEIKQKKYDAYLCYEQAARAYASQPVDAIAYYEEIIPVFEETEMWIYYGSALVGLTSAENKVGNYQRSEQIAEWAVQRSKELLGPEHRVYRMALNNLVQTYTIKGKWDEAIDRTVEIMNLPGMDSASLSLNNHQLASIYLDIEDLDQAIKHYDMSYRLWEEQGRPAYKHINRTVLSLARTLRNKEEHDQALRIYKQFLPFADEKTFVRSCYGMAAAYVEKDMPDSARYFLDKGRNVLIDEKVHYQQEALSVLSTINLLEQDTTQALVNLRGSQEIRLARRNKVNPTLVWAYANAADLLERSGKYKEALIELQKAMAILQSQPSEPSDWEELPAATDIDHYWYMLRLLTIRAKSLWAMYESNPEESLLNQIRQTVELTLEVLPQIQKLQLSDQGKLGTSQSARPIIEIGIKAEKARFLQKGNPQSLWIAFRFADEIKSRLLIEEMLQTETVSGNYIPDSIRRVYQGLRADIGFFSNKINTFSSASDSTRLRNWKSTLLKLENELLSLEKDLERTYPLFANKNQNFPQVRPELFQQELNGNSILLTYFWGTVEVYIFVVRQRDIQLFGIPLGEDFEENLKAFTQNLNKPDVSPEKLEEFADFSHGLYEDLLAGPLESTDGGELYIVPDGPLSYLPFETLLLAPSSGASSFRNLPYLFQAYQIHYLNTASLVGWEGSHGTKPSQQVASFAPAYEGMLRLQNSQETASKISERRRSQAFLAGNASEANFRSYSADFEALHLAVHGNADVEDPLNAYLDFGGQPDSLGDGKLYTYELYGLSLPNKIVSLIACDAGYGKLERGEGVMSLARGFRMAGADNIMTSLWKADGRAASPITEQFYTYLRQGKKPSEALQQARQEFLSTSSPDLVHPYYWATYILIGNDQVVWPTFWQSYGLWVILFLLTVIAGLFYWRMNRV
ncbi:MAG: CHAT domain-containing tetratricopeptide repeat protein [Bacteroidota bacterium]